MTHCSKSSFFVQKSNFDFPRKLSIFWGGEKTRENVVVLDFLAVDNFDFMRKIVKKILGEKLVKMKGFCQNWIFGQKFDFSNSVQETKNEFSKLQNIAYDDKLTVVEMHKITPFFYIDNFRAL